MSDKSLECDKYSWYLGYKEEELKNKRFILHITIDEDEDVLISFFDNNYNIEISTYAAGVARDSLTDLGDVYAKFLKVHQDPVNTFDIRVRTAIQVMANLLKEPNAKYEEQEIIATKNREAKIDRKRNARLVINKVLEDTNYK
jgi:hypothetical protein